MAKDKVGFKDNSLADISRRKSGEDYIDIDQTVLEPSPHRIRNILTLEERVAAIEAYDSRPMYTKVAKMFNCSWEQIKNIIANRDAIMEFYVATRSLETKKDPDRFQMRLNKIRFLGECLYEYIQRAQFHAKALITEDLLRMKAIEFRAIMQIENFVPNKAWINHFKATYNFSLSNRQIVLTRTPPASLDLRDIMTYCTKARTTVTVPVQQQTLPTTQNATERRSASELYRTATRIAISGENEAALREMKERRLRKINLLTKVLTEYWHRATYHQKLRMNENSVRKTAIILKEMLKIDNFYPDKEWLDEFIQVAYPKVLEASTGMRTPPPLSLDLKDILSYCSRQEHKQAASTITLAPKEKNAVMVTLPPAAVATVQAPLVQIHTFNLRQSDEATAAGVAVAVAARTRQAAAQGVKPPAPMPFACNIKEEVIELDADSEGGKRKGNEEEEEHDVKPDPSELLPPAPAPKPLAQTQAKRSEVSLEKALKAAAATTMQTAAPTTQTSAAAAAAEEARKCLNNTNESGGSSQKGTGLRVVSLRALVPPPLAALPTNAMTPVTANDTQTTAVTTTPAPATVTTTTPPLKRKLVRLVDRESAEKSAKRKKIESNGNAQSAEHTKEMAHSPGHWSEDGDRDEEELPKHVTSYKDALKLLKPLEEFAMLEENYRVIGLISQLEEIFKHPPQKDDD